MAPPPSPTPRRAGLRTVLTLATVVLLAGAAAEGARAWVHRQRADALRAVARPGDIRMISSTTCVYCTQARQWLTQYSVPFEECFIERDATCRADYERLGRPGTPTLQLRDQVQRGFDAQRITAALTAATPR